MKECELVLDAWEQLCEEGSPHHLNHFLYKASFLNNNNNNTDTDTDTTETYRQGKIEEVSGILFLSAFQNIFILCKKAVDLHRQEVAERLRKTLVDPLIREYEQKYLS